ncbi:MAG: reprolysin-like metallopeptidase [Sulfuricella sp.]
MNKMSVVSAALAALLASSLAISATSAPIPAPATKTVKIEADSIESLNAAFLKSAAKNKIVSLSLDGKLYQYRVAYSRFDGEDGEVTLELVNDPSKKATFGIRGSYVSAFIRTPKATYAMGYSGDAPVIGKASTTWTTPSLSELPAVNGIRIAGKTEKAPVFGASPMILDTHLLAGMKPGDEASFALPGLGAVRVVSESSKPGAESSTWQGYLSDFGKTYTATITWNNEGMSGYIVTPQGGFTVSKTATTGAYVWNPTALGLKHGENAASCAADTPKDVKAAQVTAQATSGTTQQQTVVSPSVQGQSNTIDILIYYTNGMLTRYGSVAALTAAIDNYIALTNQAYAAGGLSYQMRRVGLKLINVSDTTDNITLLSQLSSDSAPFSVVNSDRTATGADLVTIIRPFHADSQKSCGNAWVGGENNGLSQFQSYKSYMMSVLSDGVDLDTGSAYCDELVLAHETGHNLGLVHDRATIASLGGSVGVLPYAFGYAVPQKWGSIMSYTFPHIVRFSNPNDTTCGTGGTEMCGVQETSATSANNVKALGLTMPIVSGFYGAVTTTQPSVQVVEFYNTNLDNYFITADAIEAAAIDNGSAGPGWSRTGNAFKSGGSSAVCRFYGSQSPGPNSHFYTVNASECADLKLLQAAMPATEKRWNSESLDFLSTAPTNGTCPSGTLPVYRAYNNGYARGVDSNHRITTDLAGIQQVVERGWIAEGVVMCAPT